MIVRWLRSMINTWKWWASKLTFFEILGGAVVSTKLSCIVDDYLHLEFTNSVSRGTAVWYTNGMRWYIDGRTELLIVDIFAYVQLIDIAQWLDAEVMKKYCHGQFNPQTQVQLSMCGLGHIRIALRFWVLLIAESTTASLTEAGNIYHFVFKR